MNIDINTIVTKYRNTVFNIGLVVVALVVARVIYTNQFKKVEELRRSISLEGQKNELFSQIGAIEKKLTAYKQVYARKEISSVINGITLLARDTGARIISIKPGDELKNLGYNELSVDLNVGLSDYHSLAKFISSLESRDYLYVIKSFYIRPQPVTPNIAKGKQDRLLVQTTISITTVQ